MGKKEKPIIISKLIKQQFEIDFSYKLFVAVAQL